MLFFGTRCERLCMMQFSLISLIPGLIRNLQDCADPELDSYERGMSKPTSLKTSDRGSLLQYMGLPLQIFGKVSSVLFTYPFFVFCLLRLPASNTDLSLFAFRTPLNQYTIGESFRSLHSTPTTRYSCRLRHKILHRRLYQLPPPAAKGPLLRYSY